MDIKRIYKNIIISLSFFVLLSCSSDNPTIQPNPEPDTQTDPEPEPDTEEPPSSEIPFSVSLLSNTGSDGTILEDYFLINLDEGGSDFEEPINLNIHFGIQTEDYILLLNQFRVGEISFYQNTRTPSIAKYSKIGNINNITSIEITDPSFENSGILAIHENNYTKLKFNSGPPANFTISIFDLNDNLIADLPNQYPIGSKSRQVFHDGKLFIISFRNSSHVLDIIDLSNGSMIRSFDSIDNYSCTVLSVVGNYLVVREDDNPGKSLRILDYITGDEVKVVSETFPNACSDIDFSDFTLERLPSTFAQTFQGDFVSLPAIYYTQTNEFKTFDLQNLSQLYNEDITPLARYIDVTREILVLAFKYTPENSTEDKFGVAYVALDGKILFVADDLDFWPSRIAKS